MKRGRGTRKQKKLPTPGPRQCHPRVGDKTPAEGCFPLSALREIAAHMSVPVAGAAARTLRTAISAASSGAGAGERSWLTALPIPAEMKERLAKQYLRPAKPEAWNADPDMWLDTNDITNAINQYEEARPDFEFMGPFPIDFAAPDPYNRHTKKCLISEICNFRIQDSIQKGKKYIGVIYNLDPHFKSGSHWVSNFIDIPAKRCYYFDSYGMEPPAQIARFMKWLTTHEPGMKLQYNGRRCQFKDSECGMYSLYFIMMMLYGADFRQLVRRKTPDMFMLEMRDWIYST